jgi:hypothetical protein
MSEPKKYRTILLTIAEDDERLKAIELLFPKSESASVSRSGFTPKQMKYVESYLLKKHRARQG